MVLSLTTCHIPPTHTERVDFLPQFCWLLTGKGGRWEVFLNVYRLMLNEEGWKINTAECLRGRRGFCIFEKIRRYFHSLQKNIQASLILFHSFIRIFEINSKILSLVAKKYSSKLDIISLVYLYLCACKCKWKQLEYSNLYFYA